MIEVKKQTNWTEHLRLFGKQNHLRPTRLGVFEGEPGDMRDYWLEDGLPFAGIDVDTRGEGAPTIEIMLGQSQTPDARTMTHTVRGVRSTHIVLSPDGSDDGLEIKDCDGSTTFLRFENFDPK
ncbi:MAG: hypothetical protein HKN25_10860 [Pyrinomonadaceae bacterium]|nr:hypothetical protein [Pyrinomonadaceae bacterium]